MASAEAPFDSAAVASLPGGPQIQARSLVTCGRQGLGRALEEVFRRGVWELIRKLSGRHSGVNVYAPFDGSLHIGLPQGR
jgi:hypothetical protein